jgi:hypothetical protein
VWVPKSVKRTSLLVTMLPRRVGESIGHAIKADRVLAGADANVRREYELRASRSEPGLEPAPERRRITQGAGD